MADWILIDIVDKRMDDPTSFIRHVEANSMKVTGEIFDYY